MPYTVFLNYQPSLLMVIEATMIVLIGPISNFIVFIMFVGVHWTLQKVVGNVPDVGSKFVLVYGLHTFLHPITLLVVDCALQVTCSFTYLK